MPSSEDAALFDYSGMLMHHPSVNNVPTSCQVQRLQATVTVHVQVPFTMPACTMIAAFSGCIQDTIAFRTACMLSREHALLLGQCAFTAVSAFRTATMLSEQLDCIHRLPHYMHCIHSSLHCVQDNMLWMQVSMVLEWQCSSWFCVQF